MADIGYISLVLGIFVALYALVAAILGIRNQDNRLLGSARGAVVALAFLATVASVALFYLFWVSDFSVRYVAENSSRGLPALYKISAFWAGQPGSLLLWEWFLTLFTAGVAFTSRREAKDMVPYATVVMLIVNLFFLVILSFFSNPFARLFPAAYDGNGLNPLLQNPGMIIHPITLYVGYVGFTVPYAFAITALILNRSDDAWIKLTRRWTLFTWLFLSIGIIYGAQWAYVELGWGGYWAWDPVENASLLPWLTGTAFFHSVMIQEKRGMLKLWNINLIIATFALSIFGTFLTRSGVLASVHAFGDSKIGALFIGFLAVIIVVSLALVYRRLDTLRSENKFQSYLSRESSFLFNNLLLVGIAFAVFWGTVFPLISEAVRGVKVTVGPPFFNQITIPFGIALMLLIGVCPLIAWRKSSADNLRVNFLYPFGTSVVFMVAAYLLGIRHILSLVAFATVVFVATTILLEVFRGVRVRRKMTGENPLVALVRLTTRNRRRYGGYMVHLAMVIMVIGFTGMGAFQQEVTKSVKPGEAITIGSYTLTYPGLYEQPQGENTAVYTDLAVTKDGKLLGILRPEKVYHPNHEEPSTEVAIKGGLKEDLFVILAAWDKGGIPATFKILVNPLVAWIWLGEYVLIIGTLFAFWPERSRVRQPQYKPAPAPEFAQGGR